MTLASGFRVSFYVSLGIACLCLFYGEFDFQPWLCLLVFPLGGFMVVAYRKEGQWDISEPAANRLGTAIGMATLLWVYYKIPRTDEDLLAAGVPWPAALLPLLSPLLPVLLLVKLFRPKKLADFWFFQSTSLVLVTLSCVLAGDVVFFLLLSLFLASLLWCLGLFFLNRQRLEADTGPVDPQQAPLFLDKEAEDPAVIPWTHLGTRQAMRWTLAIISLGMVLFFLTPRYTDSQWVPTKLSAAGKVIMRTGFDTGIDLNREGTVELSADPAFEVQVQDSKGPAQTLPGHQRWRMQVLDYYDHGKWCSWLQKQSKGVETEVLPSEEHFKEKPRSPADPPYPLEEGQLYLCYKVKIGQAGGLPLADPLDQPEEAGFFPHLGSFACRSPFFRWVPGSDSVVVKGSHNRRSTLSYGQIITPNLLPEDNQKGGLPAYDVSSKYHNYLLSQEVPPALKTWTRNLLLDFASLKDEDLAMDLEKRYLAPKHEKLARALTAYLAESGYFTYSLKLRRADSTEDPTVDFLLNVREGHCERYAGGLALMLRSAGIPARVVKGYLGSELQEPGHFLVRQNLAHSWVEALVPGEEPESWKWISLDPTPSATASVRSLWPWLSWFWSRASNPAFVWKYVVMDYNAERQGEMVEQMWNTLTLSRRQRVLLGEQLAPLAGLWGDFQHIWEKLNYPVFMLVLGVTVGWCWWHWWGKGKFQANGSSPDTGFYLRLLKVLARHCDLRPRPEQTPLEFADLARANLGPRSPGEHLVDLPSRVVDLFYRIRFGQQIPPPEEMQRMEMEINKLEAVLRASAG